MIRFEAIETGACRRMLATVSLIMRGILIIYGHILPVFLLIKFNLDICFFCSMFVYVLHTMLHYD